MLSKLVDRFSPPDRVREEPVEYGIEDEDEDEDETGPRVSGRPKSIEVPRLE